MGKFWRTLQCVSALLLCVSCKPAQSDDVNSDSESLGARGNPSAAVVGVVSASELPITVKAFLDVIAYAEGTNGSYNITYGGGTFSSYADHPRRWRASPWGTPGVGSDAAGRYQFKSDSWDEAKLRSKLTDFSPASQDRAAVYLIKRNSMSTFEHVKNAEQRSRFNAALTSLSHVWASLPPQRYRNQKVLSSEELWRVYQKALNGYKVR